jgi:DNA-binding NarL/FixJ family response regulator
MPVIGRGVPKMDESVIKPGDLADTTDHWAENPGLRPRPFGLAHGDAYDRPSRLGILIVIEVRDFVRGCLDYWLGNSCAEFATMTMSNFDASLHMQVLEQAAAALIGVTSAQIGCDWVTNQIASLRAGRPELPIILLVEADDASRADALARQLNIQGYIPTSSTVTVAAAALRLVVAGGLYFPGMRDSSYRKSGIEATTSSPLSFGIASARLTPREEAVLSVLASGAQNKIIAYQLSMSLSTVKAHVHSIIQKLKVRNRTEVVVAARNMLVQERQENPTLAASQSALTDASTAGRYHPISSRIVA